jgi:hypothetical protein
MPSRKLHVPGTVLWQGPKIFDFLADPFERGDGSLEYDKWMLERAFFIVPSRFVAGSGSTVSRNSRSARNRPVSILMR